MGVKLILAVAVLISLAAGAAHGLRGGLFTGAATWSGEPDGAGNQGGSCGYGDAVANAPFSSMVAAKAADQSECGACFEVKCINHDACDSLPVRVTVTDKCRAAACKQGSDENVFDMSGHAFGAMAKPRRADELRAAGTVAINFEWVECNFSPPATNPAVVYPVFKIDPATTKDNFALTVMYAPGLAVGRLLTVALKNSGDKESRRMNWGLGEHNNSWSYTTQSGRPIPVTPPMSIDASLPSFERVTKVTAENVIPVGWQPGKTYFATA